VSEIDAAGERAFDDGERADFRSAEAFVARYGAADDPIAEAWIEALRAQRWSFDASWDETARPSIERAEALSTLGADRAARRLAGEGLRAAALTSDVDALARWAALTRRNDRVSAVAAAWLALAGVETPAREPESALERVEALALSSLAALESDRAAEGLELARRATRQGHDLGAPRAELFAHLALARARRLAGRAHLAVSIAARVAELAPPLWRDLAAWERIVAGDSSAAPSEGPSAELAAVVEAARRGDRGAFEASAAELERMTRGRPLYRADAGAVLDALRPDASSSSWRCGAGDPPARVAGLLAQDAGAAFVLAGPDRSAVRVAALGLAFVPGDVVRIASETGRGQRALAVIAALLLAPEGISVEELFRRVHGFAYDPELHRGVFDTLLYRVRAKLGDAGTVDRGADAVRLRVHVPVLVADPRTARSLEERVLRILAREKLASVEAAARDLAVPARTVSRALKTLVDEGACRVVRDGRAVHYEIEDSAFSEATLRTRL
jgi:hypothetical protein